MAERSHPFGSVPPTALEHRTVVGLGRAAIVADGGPVVAVEGDGFEETEAPVAPGVFVQPTVNTTASAATMIRSRLENALGTIRLMKGSSNSRIVLII